MTISNVAGLKKNYYEKTVVDNVSFAASSIAILCSVIGGNFVFYEQMPNIMKSISVVSQVRWILTITQSMEQGIQMGNHPVPYIIIVGFIVLLCVSALVSILFNKY